MRLVHVLGTACIIASAACFASGVWLWWQALFQ